MKYNTDDKYTLDDLMDIMRKLRAEDGCPWDKEQTHESLTSCLIEEAYEAVDAINSGVLEDMVEELGDVLLQVVFHAQIGVEQERFTFDDITNAISRKLIFRHPHIFSDSTTDNTEQVLQNWDKLKIEEKGYKSVTQSMQEVPKAFPPLLRAVKIQNKAHRAGFDWPDITGAALKLDEELGELKQAIQEDDKQQLKEEMGDLLFAAVNVCRFLDIDAQQCLNSSSDKFVDRFSKVEKYCIDNNLDMLDMSIRQLDEIWERVKHENR